MFKYTEERGSSAMANREHVGILKQGVRAWNQWRKEHPDIKPDLRKMDLGRKSSLSLADFKEADLSHAYLNDADLIGANLKGAKLFEASLLEANLGGANLSRADLRETDLRGVSFRQANLSEANLSGCACGTTRAPGDGTTAPSESRASAALDDPPFI
jgi:hypothetical protein